jgi:hypothetical protein
MSGEDVAREARVVELLGQLPDGERSRALLDELVADWRREAGDDPDAEAIRDTLEDEARAAFRGATPRERLDWVHAEVLDRRLRVLSRRALMAARGLLDGSLEDAAVRAEGRAILSELERLSPELQDLQKRQPTRDTTWLQQALEDVLLDGLYLVERQAMSRRFAELFGAEAPLLLPLRLSPPPARCAALP